MVSLLGNLSRLTSVPTEMEASILVAALDQNGIRAAMSGEATAGFRAEAPGSVQVLVAEEDLQEAQAILDDLRQRSADVDWTQVDVGEPEDNDVADSAPWWTSLSLWRRVAYVVILAGVIWVVASFAIDLIAVLLRAV
jgi:hypothetical protein